MHEDGCVDRALVTPLVNRGQSGIDWLATPAGRSRVNNPSLWSVLHEE
jgi:hypothetical protein